MAEILRTEKLTRDFGSLRAVNNVDFSVMEGEIRSVIGSNGAGKSTFLDLIINRLQPTSGRVYFNRKDITNVAPHRIVEMGIGRCFQISKLFPMLSVYENVQIPCIKADRLTYRMFNYGRGACRERVEELLDAVGTGIKAINKPVFWRMAISGVWRSRSRSAASSD